MADSRSRLTRRYRLALRRYAYDGGEESLQAAYELGREALRKGLGVFDMVRLHQEAWTQSLFSASDAGELLGQIRASETFRLEALSPFEIAHRGFRKTWEQLQRAKGALELRNRQLDATNRRLARQIGERKATEAALRETRDHYLALFRQARTMEGNLRMLSARVVTAQEEERLRVSRELHDEIGQTLLAVNAAVALLKRGADHDPQFLRKIAFVHALLEQSMGAVRQFARELRPPAIDNLGLADALRAYLGDFKARTGLETGLRVETDVSRLDPQRAMTLFRVAQESLTNVFKHARATRAEVRLFRTARGVGMEIHDDGRAFRIDSEAAPARKGRLGLLGMRERVQLAGGEFTLLSRPGSGTTVRASVPIGANRKPSQPLRSRATSRP